METNDDMIFVFFHFVSECSCRTQNMGFQGLIKIIYFGSDKETTKNNILFHTDSPVIVAFLLGEPQITKETQDDSGLTRHISNVPSSRSS